MSKTALFVALAAINLVAADKVPVYSGGPAGFGGNAAQDAFNALGEAIP